MHLKQCVIRAALGLGLSVAGLSTALAQTFPAKPISIIVTVAAGGAADISLRMISQKVGDVLKQPLVIENRPGGNGVVAAVAVKQAAPDGYTLMMGHLSLALSSYLIANVPFDAVKDFKPVTTINLVTPFLTVPASSPARNVAELVALAKSRPKGLFYAHPGSGSASHLLPEKLRMATGIQLTPVIYKGASNLVADLVEGRSDLYFGSINVVLPQVDAGKLRILAVGSTQRWEQLPQIPTMAEAGFPGNELEFWFGLVAPAGTPDPVVRTLQQAFARVLAEPEIKLAYAKQGWRTGGITPEQFQKLYLEDRERWGQVIKEVGLKPE